MFDIFAFGHALVDEEFDIDDEFLSETGIEKSVRSLIDYPRRQQLCEALDGRFANSHRACGGSGANSIIAASHLGAKAHFACRVADDKEGHFFMDDLTKAGVDVHSTVVAESGAHTGVCMVMVTADAERTMNTYTGVTDQLDMSSVDQDKLLKSSFLYLEGYLVFNEQAFLAACECIKLTRAAGNKVVVNCSDPAVVRACGDRLRQWVALGVDVLFCNEQEAMVWTGESNALRAIGGLYKQVDLLVVTRGAKGATVVKGTQSWDIAPVPVVATNTNGAGDMFAGAFVYGLSQNWDLQHCGDLASLAAATLVEHAGARLPKAKLQQLKARIMPEASV